MNGIGSRIKEARLKKGLNQDRLAALCGWEGAGRISNYEAGRREPNSGDMQLIAEALGVSAAYLWTGQQVAIVGSGIPVIELATLSDESLQQDQFPASMAASWTICPVNHGPRTFAFRITDDAMTNASEKSIPQGYFVWVDPDQRAPQHDKPVLARLDSGQYVVAQYMAQAGREWLHLLNNAYPPLSGAFSVIGRVVFKGEET